MKAITIIIALTFMQSCSTSKNNKPLDQSIYRLIINDIKNTKEFKDFKSNEEDKCSIFLVTKYEYHLCEFGIFFKDKSIREIYKKRCDNVDLSTLETEKDDLDKFSDKGTYCYIVHFSEKTDDKIIVEIIPKKAEGKIGYESLYYLYQIIGNNQIKKLENIRVIHD